MIIPYGMISVKDLMSAGLSNYTVSLRRLDNMRYYALIQKTLIRISNLNTLTLHGKIIVKQSLR